MEDSEVLVTGKQVDGELPDVLHPNPLVDDLNERRPWMHEEVVELCPADELVVSSLRLPGHNILVRCIEPSSEALMIELGA